ncbi:MAG: NADPH-dependent FMN reductase [Ferrimicrobium sp.]
MTVTIVGLSGSVRERSWNTLLLRSIGVLLPDGVDYEVIDTLGDLPFYDEALDLDGPPSAVLTLRNRVREAYGVVIASPEYNYSYSAVIKNAIDWLSRPQGMSVLQQKPVALVGASPGLFGTLRAQAHLRQVLHGTNSLVITRPEVFVSEAAKRFDDEGVLVDPTALSLSSQLLSALLADADLDRSERVA